MWVTYGKTESMDDLPLVNWGRKRPTDSEIEAEYKRLLPDEYEAVGFVSWSIQQANPPSAT